MSTALRGRSGGARARVAWPRSSDPPSSSLPVGTAPSGSSPRSLPAPAFRWASFRSGTGNDFARANGIPDDVAGALDRIVRRSTRAIDLLEVNGRPFVTAGGIGIGAHSALVVPWIKALHPLARMAADSLGSGVYRIAAGANVMFRPGARRTRATDVARSGRGGGSESRRCARTACSSRTSARSVAASRCRFRRTTRMARWTCVVVHDVARVRLLAALTRLLRGSAIASNVFSAWRAVRVTIETERKSAFFGCGDLVAEGTKFEVRVVPGALRVLI